MHVSRRTVFGFVASIALFVSSLVVIVFFNRPTEYHKLAEPVSDSDLQNGRFRIYTDPPNAEIRIPNGPDSSDGDSRLVGKTNSSLLDLITFGIRTEVKDQRLDLLFRKDGYLDWRENVSVNELLKGVYPPRSQSIIALQPTSFFTGAWLRHPVATILTALSALGLLVFGLSGAHELRRLKEIEELRKRYSDDDFVGNLISVYLVGPLLGKGGYGAVYQVFRGGREKATEAIKISRYSGINPGMDQELKDRFEREMFLVKDLEHRNIGKVIEFDSTEKYNWVVMPLYEGGELEEKIRGGALSRGDILHYARGIADGLTLAHSKDICHRDLKPANVMVHQGEAVIIDFGLARSVNSKTLTMEGAMMGTPAYMPPEQLMDSRTVTHKADQYAFGIMLFEMVTKGRVPFDTPREGGEIMAMVQEKLMKGTKKLREIDPTQSAELEEVLARMTASEPEDRYPTVMDAFLAFEKAFKAS